MSGDRVVTLLRNEALKARHRLAFWTGLLVFLLFVFLIAFIPFYATLSGESGAFRLPQAWPTVALGAGPLGGLFGATVLILLIGSEWDWRTSRQNVIDGLSRREWFLGKALLWLALALVFYGAQVVLAGGMAALNGFGEGPLVSGTDLLMMAGGLFLVVAYLGLGFLAAFLVRRPGSAIGLFFLWIVVEGVAGGLLAGHDGWRGVVARYRPLALFGALGEGAQYDVGGREAMAQRMLAMGQEAPRYLDTPVLFAGVAAWLAVFVAVSWLVYRRRDL